MAEPTPFLLPLWLAVGLLMAWEIRNKKDIRLIHQVLMVLFWAPSLVIGLTYYGLKWMFKAPAIGRTDEEQP